MERHQRSTHTSLDRYPEIFTKVTGLLHATTTSKILSFGCSTGEELVTLRRYFSLGTLVGADVNRRALRIARRTTRGLQDVRVLKSSSEGLTKEGPFDAIFAMSVLCRHPDTSACEVNKLYSFEAFQRSVAELDELLSVGGLLVCFNTNYQIEDLDLIHRYEIVDCNYAAESWVVSLFDRSGNRLRQSKPPHCVFRKLTNGVAWGKLSSPKLKGPLRFGLSSFSTESTGGCWYPYQIKIGEKR